MKKLIVLFTLTLGLVITLVSCSSSNEVIHLYEDNELNIEGGNAKVSRLECFSQGQVYLKENEEYPIENITAGQALLFELNGSDNPVILCKNAYQEFKPGFLTRLIACGMVAESSDIYEAVTVTGDIFQMDPSFPACGFINGDVLRVKDLIYGATINGKYDVMIPLAYFYSGNINNFLTDLKQYVLDNGCEQTLLSNVYGSNGGGQHINIYDLYLLLPKLLSNSDIYEALCTRVYDFSYTNNEGNYNCTLQNYLPYFNESGFGTTSGLSILGGITENFSNEISSMLTIAQSADGRVYVAYVNGCSDYENTKNQMEIILGKILN